MARTMKKTRSSASRRRSYAKHRKTSHCKGIKRSAVCKRTTGCKYAKGKKRSFCRRSHNKRH